MPIQFFASQDFVEKIQDTAFYKNIRSHSGLDNVFVYAEPDLYHNEIQSNLTRSENVLLLGCAKTGLFPLLSSFNSPVQAKVLGFNSIPFFLSYPKIEITLFNESEKHFFENLFHQLHLQAFFVEDSPGFVSARVICMIVNEAAFMVTEQIADFQSIDLGMKLGTNYPYGPSEWLEKVGIDYIYPILKNLHERNPTGRYKIAPYLQKLYHQHKIQKKVS